MDFDKRPGFWRGVVGFFVFAVAYLLGAAIIEFLFSLANMVSHGWPESWGRIGGAALGGGIGVGIGKITLDAVLKRYPAKAIAGVFIILNLAIVVGDVATLAGQTDKATTAAQVVRGIVAIATTVYLLWLGHGPSWAPPARGRGSSENDR